VLLGAEIACSWSWGKRHRKEKVGGLRYYEKGPRRPLFPAAAIVVVLVWYPWRILRRLAIATKWALGRLGGLTGALRDLLELIYDSLRDPSRDLRADMRRVLGLPLPGTLHHNSRSRGRRRRKRRKARASLSARALRWAQARLWAWAVGLPSRLRSAWASG
jgi:hypothetical protein